MFEGIKIFSVHEYVSSFIPKSWTNIWQSKLAGIRLMKGTF